MSDIFKKLSTLLVVMICSFMPVIAQTVKLTKEGRTYKVACKVNGLNLNMYLDTGADVVTISALEALFMLKNGYLTTDDILGNEVLETASGDIAEGTQINIREIVIGWHVLRNVKATIVHSLDAPLLMGQSALSKLGKITIDYEHNTLIIDNGKQNHADTKEAEVTKKDIPKDMIYVEGGDFKMGNNFGKNDEKPEHTVHVNSFYMCRAEVTVAQFRQFVTTTGYRTAADNEHWVSVWNGMRWLRAEGINWEYDTHGGKRTDGQDNEPVLYLTWNDAVRYCEWLTAQTGRHYRLPTEAEWEYAAKGGKEAKEPHVYSGSNNIDDVAWYFSTANGMTRSAGLKKPNELGIYDMTGNVMEMTADWYDEKYYQNSPKDNPHGPATGKSRVARGGGWHSTAPDSRNTDRHYDELWSRNNYNGFRVVMDAN